MLTFMKILNSQIDFLVLKLGFFMVGTSFFPGQWIMTYHFLR